MAGDGEHSVTQWVSDLKTGAQSEAARLLWQRYFDRLARLAQARLRTVAQGAADGEDVALSVLDSFFKGAADGRFPRVADRDDLWRLLVTITARKAHNQRRDEGRQKRGGGRVVGEGAFAAAGPAGDDFLAQVVGHEPTPEFAAMVTDEYRRLFGCLTDESLRVVALLRLEGYSTEEIARSLDCGLRTVERKLEVIRKRWLAEEAP
jgi:DNA-directed RNA polymerase specialized sigma24 family protein